MSDEALVSRDFYAEGVDAATAGNADMPPDDVTEAGPDAEASWFDGYASVAELEDDDEEDTDEGGGYTAVNKSEEGEI